MPDRTAFGQVATPLVNCFQNLLFLDVSYCTYFGNRDIVDLLKHNPQLRTLNIEHFDITSQFLLGIAKYTRNLIELNIANTLGVTTHQYDIGLETIFQRNQNIERFRVDSAILTPQAVKGLQIYGKKLKCLDVSEKRKTKDVSETIVKCFVKSKPVPGFVLKRH